MPAIDLGSSNLSAFEDRVNSIETSEARVWGTMSLAQMFAHLRITFEISNDERETKDESYPFLTPVIYFFLFQVFTNWPKGKIKASAQFLDDSAEDVEGERTALIESMRRFVEKAESDPGHVVLEPMLGHITLKQWQRVHGLHVDYHLRQFGA